MKPCAANQASKCGVSRARSSWRKRELKKRLLEHQARVGGEHEIGQSRLRRHQLDRHTESDERIVQAAATAAAPVPRELPRARFIHGLISYSMP